MVNFGRVNPDHRRDRAIYTNDLHAAVWQRITDSGLPFDTELGRVTGAAGENIMVVFPASFPGLRYLLLIPRLDHPFGLRRGLPGQHLQPLDDLDVRYGWPAATPSMAATLYMARITADLTRCILGGVTAAPVPHPR